MTSSQGPLSAADIRTGFARLRSLPTTPDGKVHLRRFLTRTTGISAPRERVATLVALLWVTGRGIREVIMLDREDLSVRDSPEALLVRWKPDQNPVEYPLTSTTEDSINATVTYMSLTPSGPLFPGRSRTYGIPGENPRAGRISVTGCWMMTKAIFPSWTPRRIRMSGVFRTWIEAGGFEDSQHALEVVREKCGQSATTVKGSNRFILSAWRIEHLKLHPPIPWVEIS